MGKILSHRYGMSFWIVIVAYALLLNHAAAAEDRCDPWLAKAVSVQESVEFQAAGETGWQPVRLGDTFCAGDTIQVLENSRADLSLANEAVMRLNAGSTFTLKEMKEARTSVLDVIKGALHFFSRRPRSLEVQTPTVVAGVRGTEFYLQADDQQTFLTVFQGAVLAANDAGELTLTSGQSAVAEKGRAPVIRVVAKPRDAVRWAMYYPPVIYEALPDVLDRDASDIRDPMLLAQRASLLLNVGRVEEASADIDRALQLDANYSTAYSLQSIIAIVGNDKDRALDLAQKAVEAGPNSATARIAMSYAQQARFDLEGARRSLQEAVDLEPENALAWARLSEIQAGFGELDKALKSAQRAEELASELSRTQTVLGFAYLMQVKTEQAKEAFSKAIEFDQAASLPRLGMGLAKIREGDLEEGRREMEIAASLDPNNSIIRSYLGKAYYEEKRTDLDDKEYVVAKELDPNDPTPYFYDAINKQTENRPVEALRDYQKAIELNDNRAVYRSSLQLDDDLAARSSALARIYNELGFGQLGLVEGYNSVNTDPTNFSAHRFLADTYATLPRHEIARVSELLQSQLLQPLNITPIQPGLAESNLFLISSQGAGQTSFNEFNNLMIARNRAALQASGMAGSNDTWSGEGVASAIYDKLSLSAGYTHFETDGWRENADQDDDIANIFAQYELTYKTSIQAEYRYRDSERGETQLRFFSDDLRPNLRQKTETDTVRIGFRHAFTPDTVLIGNFSYQDLTDFERNELDDPALISGFTEGEADQEAFGGEIQQLFRSTKFSLLGGAGYFDIDGEDTIFTELVFPPPPFPPGLPPIVVPDERVVNRDADHTNLYLYSYLYLPQNVTLTLGASGDFFDSKEEGTIDENQFNPKFGITWKPVPQTTIRAAGFRVLKRTLVTDQTIEPTQVAGFNQFYDDENATDSWRFGGAIDQKFSDNIYSGVEYTYRDSDVPFFDDTLGNERTVNWEERLIRAYFYWTPSDRLSLTAEYTFEKIDRSQEFADGASNVKTHYVPAGINLFFPLGFNFTVNGTYVNQEGSFERQGTLGTFEDGEDDFVLFDASINYRFPKRYGFLTIGCTNLFDKEFNYFDTDRENPKIQPDRYLFVRLTFALP